MRRLNPGLVKLLQVWGFNENKRIGLEYPGITQEGKLLHSPGRSTRSGAGPRYEPDPLAQAVNEKIGLLCCQDRLLLQVRYEEGMSDRIIGLICGIKKGKVMWAMEVAHRNMAKQLRIPVYK